MVSRIHFRLTFEIACAVENRNRQLVFYSGVGGATWMLRFLFDDRGTSGKIMALQQLRKQEQMMSQGSLE